MKKPGQQCSGHDQGSQAYKDCISAAAKSYQTGKQCQSFDKNTDACKDCIAQHSKQNQKLKNNKNGGQNSSD
jgi:hypothetical protein